MSEHAPDDVTTLTHPHPAWADRADLRVAVDVPGVEGAVEQLAVRRVTGSRVEVCCLPYALYGLSLGDVVELTGLDDAAPAAVAGLVTRSGRSLHRVVLRDPQPAVLLAVAGELAAAGHLTELWSPTLLAVDASDAAADATLRPFLADGVRAGRWQWEVAGSSAG